MAIDLQVTYPQTAINVSRIRLLTGYTPDSVYVEGDDFSSVDEVLINDEQAPNWTVLAPTVLVAQIPYTQVARGVVTIDVMSNTLTVGPESLLRFRLGQKPRKCSGIMRLVQLFVKVLLTTPGTDIYAPTMGGGLTSKIGQNVSLQDGGKGVISDLILSVDSTTSQIIATQSKNSSIPPMERLLAAAVDKTSYDKESLGVTGTVRLLNHSGQQGYANLTL